MTDRPLRAGPARPPRPSWRHGPCPTTEMTSSGRPPACGSGPPGRSPKGGFPCPPSRRGRSPPHRPAGGSWGSSPCSSSPSSLASRSSRAPSARAGTVRPRPPTASSRTRRAATSTPPTRSPVSPRPSSPASTRTCGRSSRGTAPTSCSSARRPATPGRLIIARSDGSGLVAVTPEPLDRSRHLPAASPQYTFSPDGTEIALWSTTDTGGKLWIAQSDGSGVRQVNLPLTVVEASYLPPDGAELIVTGRHER